MSYELMLMGRADKEFHKFPPQIYKKLTTEALKLKDNPTLGEQLKGNLRAFRSLHIKIQNVQYRVIYEINEAKKEIYVHAVGTRENFYVRLERMKLKSKVA